MPCDSKQTGVNCKARLRPWQRFEATSLQEPTGARLGRGRRVPPTLPPSLPPLFLSGASTSRPGTAAAGTVPHAAAAFQPERGAGRAAAADSPAPWPCRRCGRGGGGAAPSRCRSGPGRRRAPAGSASCCCPRRAALPARAEAAPGNAPPCPGGAGARPGEPRPAAAGCSAARVCARGWSAAAGMRPRGHGPHAAGTAQPCSRCSARARPRGFTPGGDWPPCPSLAQAPVASTNPWWAPGTPLPASAVGYFKLCCPKSIGL